MKNGELSTEDLKKLCIEHGNFAPICNDLLRSTPRPSEIYLRTNKKAISPPPVILLPGLGGSGFQAKLHRDNTPLWYCFKTWDWFGIWVELYDGILAQKCWLDNLGITYFASNNTYGDTRGVDIRPNDFGGLRGVNKLDHFDDPFGFTDYFMYIIDQLEDVGYTGGTDLFGAPYDWRVPADFLYQYEESLGTPFGTLLKELVEKAYVASGNQKVSFITHSMGGPTALYFLNRQSPDWKQKYMGNLIAIAGPWSGAPSALKAIVSGNNFGLQILGFSLLDRTQIAQIARQAGGVNYLTPDSDFWGNQVFVTNQQTSTNYTSNQFEKLYNDLNTPITATIHNRTNMIINNLVHPDIPTYCLYGTNVETEMGYIYSHFSVNPSDVVQPTIISYSNSGDGTVPLLSLGECKKWATETPDNLVKCKEYNLRGHNDILKDDEIVLDLIRILLRQDNILDCKKTPAYDELVQERLKAGFPVDPRRR